MAREFDPRIWQPQMIEHVYEHKRCAVYAGTGLGKGVTTLTALDQLDLMEDDVWPALVLGPLRVARKVWSEEAAKWEHLKHLRVNKVIGSADQRVAALRDDKAHIYAMNYDNLPWLIEHIGVDNWPFKTVIPDECTRLKNFRTQQGGARAAALREVAHKKTRRWVNLSGTPTPNGLKDLWGQMWFLDGGTRLGLTYSGFEERWFAYKRIVDAITRKPGIVPVIMPGADKQIHDRIRDLCLSVKLSDYVDVKEPINIRVPVQLSARARKHYRELERKMYTEIAGHGIDAVNAAAKSIKCLQLANGAVYLDPDVTNDEDPRARKFVVIDDEKIQALDSIVEEANGMPVLVAYQWKSDLARLLKAFPKGRVLDTEQDEDDFKAGRIPILFAHPKSAGHGIDGFQNVTNILVFFGQWWDLELRDQIIGRVGPERQLQAGFDRHLFIYDIVAEDTVDETVLLRHATKRSVQELFLEDMSRKGYL